MNILLSQSAPLILDKEIKDSLQFVNNQQKLLKVHCILTAFTSTMPHYFLLIQLTTQSQQKRERDKKFLRPLTSNENKRLLFKTEIKHLQHIAALVS